LTEFQARFAGDATRLAADAVVAAHDHVEPSWRVQILEAHEAVRVAKGLRGPRNGELGVHAATVREVAFDDGARLAREELGKSLHVDEGFESKRLLSDARLEGDLEVEPTGRRDLREVDQRLRREGLDGLRDGVAELVPEGVGPVERVDGGVEGEDRARHEDDEDGEHDQNAAHDHLPRRFLSTFSAGVSAAAS